ncbi:RING finger protein [Endozoicomonas sp. ALD040]|uniref:RING finger protein n=1 Tax=unclassified Endozoicomonas TaxID=2644528 RepID=UPI003BB09E84
MNGTTPPNSPNDQSARYQELSEECPICYAPFAESEVKVFEPCTHMFHERCLATWLVNNRTCPMCRSLGEREVQPMPATPFSQFRGNNNLYGDGVHVVTHSVDERQNF